MRGVLGVLAMPVGMPHHGAMEQLAQLLKSYQPELYAEQTNAFLCQHLLQTQGERSLYRDNFSPGHLTGSAWVVNPSFSRTLLIHHPKLDIWIQPGGHADGNPNLLEVAMRELEEESGYTTAQPLNSHIFDIDVHLYPERVKNGTVEPAHLHHDVRFSLIVDDTHPIPGSEENQTLAWLTLEEAARLTPADNSVQRMLAKTRALQGQSAA